MLMNQAQAQQPQVFSEVYLKRQLFKAARTNKPELWSSTVEKIGSKEDAFLYLTKKDPEGRNVIVLCFMYASVDVLKALHEDLKDDFAISDLILSQ